MDNDGLSNEWRENFLAGWASDPEHGRALADQIQRQMIHACRVLDSVKHGEGVVFEGSCPSGSTYTEVIIWDGTPQTRQKIMDQAYKNAGFHAWSAWLQPAKKVSAAMFAADMRTGRD